MLVFLKFDTILYSELPLVGGMQFFFITKPDIDFDFEVSTKHRD
jgi:hypothetical protein